MGREEGEDKDMIEIVEKAQKGKKVKMKIKEIIINEKVMKELLLSFFEASNRDEEDFLLLIGKIDDGSVCVDKMCRVPLLATTPVTVNPNGYHLVKCMEEAVEKGYSCFIMAHRHPIGSQLSGMDKRALYDYSRLYDSFYIGVGCCDVEFSIYMINDGEVYRPIIKLLPEEVEPRLTKLEDKKIRVRPPVREKFHAVYKHLRTSLRKICRRTKRYN